MLKLVPDATATPTLAFAPPARSNLAVPLVAAFAILTILGAMLLWFNPHKTADAAITHTSVYVGHTVYKKFEYANGTDIVGAPPSSEDTLYVLPIVHIDDRLRLPLFLKDFQATLTLTDHSQLQISAVQKQDLAAVFDSFPSLKPLAGTLLMPDSTVPPGGSLEGTLLFQIPVTRAIWDQRESATVTIDLYHQSPITLTIPKEQGSGSRDQGSASKRPPGR